jgi:sulfoxide reductase heme-binding subunit YedZ
MTARLKERIGNHTLTAVGSVVLFALFYFLVPGTDKTYLCSMATGYTSLILLSITLVIGPVNIIRGKINPISTDIRRDVGIWCGLIGIAHVVVGIQVHMGNIWLYFVNAVDGADAYMLRGDLFGFANYTGLLGALVLVLLLLLSNDLSLRMLKSRRWKNLQRWSYAGFILILIHGAMYQIVEKRIAILIFIFATIVIIPMLFQLRGFQRIQKK